MEYNVEKLIISNFKYFKNEILPYYFILHTNEGEIIVDTTETNLKHLMGIGKSANLKFKNMAPQTFYNYLNDGNDINLFDLIRTADFYNMTLSKEEQYIWGRNYIFQKMFDNLLQQHNIYFCKKNLNTDFDTDYVHFCWINKAGGYLGIIGGENSKYYYFNSIIYEEDNPEKYKGPRFIVKKVERILKNEFNYRNHKITISKRYTKKHTSKKLTKKKKKLLIEKTMITKANQLLLKTPFSLSWGKNGKGSIQVYKDGQIIEGNFKIILDCNKTEIPQLLVEKILDKYQ